MIKLVVLASGRGSNFEAIQKKCRSREIDAEVVLVLSNKSDAKVLEIAQKENIPAKAILPTNYQNQDIYEEALLKEIQLIDCDLIVLAGYMKVLGSRFIQSVKVPILNIHPSLLPSFPGLNAQKQAIDYGVKVSGCTVHLVDEGLDSGPIIAQKAIPVLPEDNVETLSKRILNEEHRLYSEVIQYFALQKIRVEGRRIFID